jgi:hypothetical protein
MASDGRYLPPGQPSGWEVQNRAHTSEAPLSTYSADGLRRLEGTTWVRVKRRDRNQWVHVKRDIKRPLLRVVILVALAVLALVVYDRIVQRQISNSCAGLSPTEYEACLNTTEILAGLFGALGLLVLISVAVASLVMHPIVTPAERAGRIAGDSVNIGRMSVSSAEKACRQWQLQSPTSGKRFVRGYTAMGAQPWW